MTEKIISPFELLVVKIQTVNEYVQDIFGLLALFVSPCISLVLQGVLFEEGCQAGKSWGRAETFRSIVKLTLLFQSLTYLKLVENQCCLEFLANGELSKTRTPKSRLDFNF